jgi:hypothetical protein
MVSNLAAIGIVPDFDGCYEDQMLKASAIENDLYAIRTAGERIAVIHRAS